MKKIIFLILTILYPSVLIFSQWSQIATINSPQLNAVKFFDEYTGIAVGQGGIWRSINSGVNWTNVLSGNNMNALSFFNSSIGMAVGDSLTQLTFEGNNRFPSWSPDGEWIAYETDHLDPTGSIVIWKMRKDGTDKRDISQHGVGEWRQPSWSPDGKQLVLQRGFQNSGGWEIVVMDSSGQNSVRLTYNLNWDWFPRYSPDGQKIIFSQKHETSLNIQIYTINIDGSNFTRLTDTQGYTADYSPDGEKIVYCDSSPGNGRLWIMNKDGTNKRQLTFP